MDTDTDGDTLVGGVLGVFRVYAGMCLRSFGEGVRAVRPPRTAARAGPALG